MNWVMVRAPEMKRVHLRGARLLLKDLIVIFGAVTFTGRLSLQGLSELQHACVHVWDDCTVASGAELLVQNCSNVHWHGGGLYIDRSLHVDGALEVRQSRSRLNGGGVFVWGASAQRVEPCGA